MMNRRGFLTSASGLAAMIALRPHIGLASSQGRVNARLHALFDRMYASWLERSPEGLTDLGLDVAARAAARSRLDDRSRAATDGFIAEQRGFVRELAEIDPATLSAEEGKYRDIVVGHLRPAVDGAARHRFGTYGDSTPFVLNAFSGVQPYVLGNLNGAYFWMPDFLINKHSLRDRGDVEAYVARLEQLATVLDQETERARGDVEDHGVIPPNFIIDRTLQQMRTAREVAPRQAPLVRNLAEHLPSKASTRAVEDAVAAIERRVNPALDRQIAFMRELRPRSGSEAGVRRLKDGEAYYAYALRVNTSTTMSAESIHKIGLEQVAEITARADALLKQAGYRDGSVGARLAALSAESRFQFSNDAQGKAAILALFRSLTERMDRRLPAWFGNLPPGELRIEAVPAALEASAPRGYYQRGTLDGSRPGVYFANLRSTADWTRFYLPTFAYHEGVPGHHLQFAVALEDASSPALLKLLQMPGYSEGWALYAEQLADEMGAYADDPFGRIGYLQSSLFRAVRLVVDTGIHHHRWDRDRAVRYIAETVGDAARSGSEVDRYISWPGQACSYKLGHTQWNDIRRGAQAALGERFDIKAFHDVTLRHGAMPFDLLRKTVAQWVESFSEQPGP